MEKLDENNLLELGANYYKNNDLLKARDCYQKALDQGIENTKSLYSLANIALKTGNYQQARDLLYNTDLDGIAFLRLKVFLEESEYNFQQEESLLYQMMSEKNQQVNTMLLLAKFYVQMGDYQLAENIYRSLTLDRQYRFNAMRELVSIAILKGDYEQAFYQLNMIDFKRINNDPNVTDWYRYAYNVITTELGVADAFHFSDRYRNQIIQDKSANKILVTEHIKKHVESSNSFGTFFQYTDLANLYDKATEEIRYINPIFYQFNMYYRMSLGTPIGLYDDKLTSDIAVVNVFNQPEIITIYPIKLSDQFDQEGYSKSKKISQKRMMNQKNREEIC